MTVDDDMTVNDVLKKTPNRPMENEPEANVHKLIFKMKKTRKDLRINGPNLECDQPKEKENINAASA